MTNFTGKHEINIAQFQEMRDMLGQKFAAVMETFIEDIHLYMSQIEDGFAASNAEQIMHAAHPMKSSSASLGFMGLSKIARVIEETARQIIAGQGKLADLTAELTQLREAVSEAETNLKQVA